MATKPQLNRLEAPRLWTVTSEMAKWLRVRRSVLELSQEEVVARLADLGAPLSRGHYANLERGQTELRAEYVAALDTVLKGNGDLIALADKKWDRAIALARGAEWAQIGRTLERSLVGDLAPASTSELDHVQEKLESQSDDEALVIEGAGEVQDAVTALLSIAANTRPQIKPIEFSGTFTGFRAGGRAGLPAQVRHALRSALERGWKCRHHIPVPRAPRPDASLVFVASPLFACENFDATIVDPEQSPTVENLLIIPDVASVQFFATSSPAFLDVAVIHKKDEMSRVLAERMRQVNHVSEPFVERFERTTSSRSEQTKDEIKFRRLLADVATIEGPCRLFLGWFSTATVPKEDYARSVEERSRLSKRTEPRAWTKMIELQSQRADLLEEHLDAGVSYRTIITRDLLMKFAAGTRNDAWKYANPDDMLRRLDRVLTLLKRSAFEVAIAPEKLAQRLRTCNWEVREGGARGVVIVQTQYTPVTRGAGRNAWRDVDLKIEATGAVRAFMAYYSELWDECDNDQRSVTREIRKARNELAARL